MLLNFFQGNVAGGAHGCAGTAGNTKIRLDMKGSIYFQVQSPAGQGDRIGAHSFAGTGAQSTKDTGVIFLLKSRFCNPVLFCQVL